MGYFLGKTKRLELPLEVAVPPIVEARALNGNEVTVVVAPGNPKGIARPEVAVGRIEDRNQREPGLGLRSGSRFRPDAPDDLMEPMRGGGPAIIDKGLGYQAPPL